ncbi:hypothetical protein ABK040_002028 [Willaertia magna]
MEHFLSTDVLFLISKYLDDIKDYLHLLQINKFVYHNVLNNNEIVLRNELFKKKLKTLSTNLPKYLFRIETLNLKKSKNINLLNNFQYLKSLKISKLPNDFVFNDNLLNLEKLNVKDCCLQSNTLSNLKQLKTLILRDCNLNDDCIKELKNLTKLCIWTPKNRIASECLQNFPNLTTLKTLFCFSDKNYLKNVENLQYLKTLFIWEENNIIKNTNFVKNLIHLQNLTLNVEEIVECDLYSLQNLRNLSIFGEGTLDKCFNYLKNLEELQCDLETIVNSNNVHNLKNLNIRSVPHNIVDEELKRFTNLVEFSCHRYQFTGKYLTNNLNLTKLRVSCSQVKEEYLMNLKKLKLLDISNCKHVTGDCLREMIHLEELRISGLKNITDTHLEKLRELKVLSAFGCEGIIGNGLQNSLKSLFLDESNIKDEYLINLKQLKELRVSKCKNFTGECLLNLPKLKTLHCDDTTIKDEYLINLKSIKYLNISNCRNITGEGFSHLRHLNSLNINKTNVKEEYLNNFVKLEELHIADCPNITKGQFLLNMKKLKYVETAKFCFTPSNIGELRKGIENGKAIEEIAEYMVDPEEFFDEDINYDEEE